MKKRHKVPLHILELIILKIQSYQSLPFNFVTWYRSSSAGIDSFKQLEAVISFLNQEGHETLLVGDTKWDFSFKHRMVDGNYSIPNHVDYLNKLYDHYGCTQLIKEATSVTASISSIIDHIVTTNTYNIYQSRVIKKCISDHCIVVCNRKFERIHKEQHKKQHKFIYCRRIKNIYGQKFYDKATSLPWWYIVRRHDNINSTVNYFTEILVSLIEKHAPLKLTRASQKQCPWPNVNYHALI